MDIIMTYSSGVISSFGIASTICTMGYFRSQKYQLQTAESCTRYVYKMLNFFDLLVCVASMFFLIHGELMLFPEEFKIPSGYWFLFLILMTSVHITGFLTCMMAITRFINTIWTSYLLDVFAMTISVILFTVLASSLEIGPYLFRTSYTVAFILQFIILASMFAVIVATCCVTLSKLNSVQSEDHDNEEREHTTHTVIWLCFFYCVFNVGNLLVLVAGFSGDNFTLPDLLSLGSTYILLPLKSALNPVIYFTRTAEMKMWMSNLWKKLTAGDGVSDKELEQLQSNRREEIIRRRSSAANTRYTGGSRHGSPSSGRKSEKKLEQR